LIEKSAQFKDSNILENHHLSLSDFRQEMTTTTQLEIVTTISC